MKYLPDYASKLHTSTTSIIITNKIPEPKLLPNIYHYKIIKNTSIYTFVVEKN
jgi:hypothetical protein